MHLNYSLISTGLVSKQRRSSGEKISTLNSRAKLVRSKRGSRMSEVLLCTSFVCWSWIVSVWVRCLFRQKEVEYKTKFSPSASRAACRPVNKKLNSLVDDKFALRRQCLMLESVRSLIRSNDEVDDSEGIKKYANSLRAVCAQKSLRLSFTMEEKWAEHNRRRRIASDLC